MKTKFFVAVLASVATIAQVNGGGVRGGGGVARGGAVAHPGAVAHGGAVARAPMRAGGISSFHPMPARGFGGGGIYPRQRYSSFGMRSYRPNQFRQSFGRLASRLGPSLRSLVEWSPMLLHQRIVGDL